MKLDLNKPWIMKLVSQNSTVNGCSFIRGVILHTIWKAILWTVGVTLGSILFAALLGGAYMWFHEPAYFYAGFENRMTYFGTDWIAFSWALLCFLGGIIWGVSTFLVLLFSGLWLIVQGIGAAHPTMSSVAGKVWDAVTPSDTFQEAVSAWYHKFCPTLEIILPDAFLGYKVGARVAKKDVSWNHEGDELVTRWDEGTIMSVELNGNRLDVDVLWDASVNAIDEYFALPEVMEEYDTPEELEEARQYSLNNRNRDYRLWFGSDNSDFKLVEESSSPA